MQVKVFNDNVHPYKETFRDKTYEIAPGGFVEMEEDLAMSFLGSCNGVMVDHDGQPDPRGFKKLRVVAPAVDRKPVVMPDANACIVCKAKFASQAEVLLHLQETHSHLAAHDEEAEKLVEAKKAAKQRKA